MLILKAWQYDDIVIGGEARLVVVQSLGGVRLGFEAAKEIPIHRGKVWRAIEAEVGLIVTPMQRLREKIAALEAENVELQGRLAALENPTVQERVARAQATYLDMVERTMGIAPIEDEAKDAAEFTGG